MFSHRSLFVLTFLCLSVAVLSAPIVESNELEARSRPVAVKKSSPKTSKPAANAKKPVANAKKPVANAKQSPANACARLKPSPALNKHHKRSFVDELVHLFSRNDPPMFIGWHGTNSRTAQLWTSNHEVIKPTTAGGKTAGQSGLDAELGPGLYITDTLSLAETAAVNNYQFHIRNKDNQVRPSVCAIIAKSGFYWHNRVSKVQIPELLRGNQHLSEIMRQKYIQLHHGDAGTVRFGPLRGNTINQALIPESRNPSLTALCFDVNPQTGISQGAQAYQQQMGHFSPYSEKLQEWGIAKEDVDMAQAVKIAVTHNSGC